MADIVIFPEKTLGHLEADINDTFAESFVLYV